jgi:hypothetical protein
MTAFLRYDNILDMKPSLQRDDPTATKKQENLQFFVLLYPETRHQSLKSRQRGNWQKLEWTP